MSYITDYHLLLLALFSVWFIAQSDTQPRPKTTMKNDRPNINCYQLNATK